jgi:hypothetical protein
MESKARMTWIDPVGRAWRIERITGRWSLSRYSPTTETWLRVGSFPTREAAIQAASGQQDGASTSRRPTGNARRHHQPGRALDHPQARNLPAGLGDRAGRFRLFVRDRAGQFARPFDAIATTPPQPSSCTHRDPNTPVTKTGPTHRPTTDPRRPHQRIPASRLSQQRHRPNIGTPQVAQANQLRQFLRSAGGRACRRLDVAAGRRVRLLGLPHISLCHRAAACDQVDEHAEKWQDDDEDQPQRLTPATEILAAEDVDDDAEEQDPQEELNIVQNRFSRGSPVPPEACRWS